MSSEPRRVLIVEDDPLLREIFETILEHAGYRVDTAADGPQAFVRVEASRPDLLVLDIGLPVMDGWQVLAKLRERPGGFDVPVLVVTAALVDEALDRAEREGCASYLLKPVAPRELVAEVEGIIGKP